MLYINVINKKKSWHLNKKNYLNDKNVFLRNLELEYNLNT